MMRTRFLLMMSSIVVALSMSLPVEAWVAAGARGVAVGGYGAGCYHGAYGSSAAWSHGSGSASGYHGSASWSHGSGSATAATVAALRGAVAQAPTMGHMAVQPPGVDEPSVKLRNSDNERPQKPKQESDST
jgi:hypothetical protein